MNPSIRGGQYAQQCEASDSSRNATNIGQSAGSLLATRGGFSNLRNKDQIRDQMLASINKIKSFRETGEFDMSAGATSYSAISGMQ